MSHLDDYDLERSHELEARLDRDAEKEPRAWTRATPRRKQFRYWSGAMFRPARVEISSPEIGSPRDSIDCQNLPSRVDARAKRAVHYWPILDEKKPPRSAVGSSQRYAILRREA